MKAKAGDIAVSVNATESAPPSVMMQLSVPTPVEAEIDLPALANALGVAKTALETRAPIGVSDAGLKHLFVHLSSFEDVQNLAPDFQELKDLSIASGVQTIACFAMESADPLNTLHIRDFCPALGVDEVPASGTTNGALAGYLLQHGLIENASQRILAEQGAEIGRPSIVCSEIEVAAGKITKLSVGGQAVASLKGAILV
jgi:PhzF family phenazine biosynthesis protein